MRRREVILYVLLLGACLVVSVAAGFTTLGAQLDNDVYDFLFRIRPEEPWQPDAVILGVDELSLNPGGARHMRRILAEGLELLAASPPKALIIDLLLVEPADPADDARLQAALARIPNLVLATDITRHGWEAPLPEFSQSATAIAHVHADPDPYDNVLRQIPLEKSSGRRRYFALALEAYRLAKPVRQITETPEALHLDGLRLPAPRDASRPMRIWYLRSGSIPEVTFHELRTKPGAAAGLHNKVAFVGVTAQSLAQDRHMTPYSFGQTMPGVEIHANAYETLRRGVFLEDAAGLTIVVVCLLLTAVSGLIFWRMAGWLPYTLGASMLAGTHLAPYIAFRNGVVFPYAGPIAAAWLSIAAAASFQHFIVRRRLRRAQAEKDRYQQAIHFVAHEMRTPLSAIQGSSEIMGRYKLTEEKRAQMTQMIHSESKRLARMIQTFLDVERLSEGQMELARQPFAAAELADTCLERVRPLAERKRIRLLRETVEEVTIIGDRELMEYALYNLLTNAVKYSNPDTEVRLRGQMENGNLRLAVQDQGIGMDEKELKNIFQKFYRTQKAESSGEAGTGIGLSIVEQIVARHGGKMEVASQPGAGSCFTMVVPAQRPATEEG
jgi:signal transduction histidine kinase